MDFLSFAEIVKNAIKRPNLTLCRNIDYVQKIAVVAGGGDIPEILQHAYDAGCDTLLAGTIKQLWGLPFIQEGNRKFHELNNTLKRNLIGGTHYATERPAMIRLSELIGKYGIDCEYCEDEGLLSCP